MTSQDVKLATRPAYETISSSFLSVNLGKLYTVTCGKTIDSLHKYSLIFPDYWQNLGGVIFPEISIIHGLRGEGS